MGDGSGGRNFNVMKMQYFADVLFLICNSLQVKRAGGATNRWHF
jgi:hypothetical protein